MGYFNMSCVNCWVCKDDIVFFKEVFGMVYLKGLKKFMELNDF